MGIHSSVEIDGAARLRPTTWVRFRERRRELPGLLTLLVFLLVGFDQINGLAAMRTSAALAHGRSVLRIERLVDITPEGPASRWLVRHHVLSLLFNWTYNTEQICLTTLVVGWLWWRHRSEWRSLRWVLLGTNLVAMLVFWTYPVAPPRLVPGSGVADTIAAVPVLAGWGPGIQPHLPDQFQALPSLHLAWASWITLSIWVVSRRRSALPLALAYPVVVGVVVVVTGAHSLVDIVAGVATTAILWVGRSAVLHRRARAHPVVEVEPYAATPSRSRYRAPAAVS